MHNTATHSLVFSKNVVEFVTVALQYCSYLESNSDSQTNLTDKLTKLLPLLYLKATLLPDNEASEDDFLVEEAVAEDDYNYIVSRLFSVFKNEDAYLEVFEEDMKYSDTPISASIAENLTDIYQDVKNFISVYERGIEDNMSEALFVCTENFKLYWGQKLVNVLRPLHALKYSTISKNDDLYSANLENDSEYDQ